MKVTEEIIDGVPLKGIKATDEATGLYVIVYADSRAKWSLYNARHLARVELKKLVEESL